MFGSFLSVAFGGALGSVCRWLLSRLVVTSFPLATLVVNVAGCFLIGFLSGLALKGFMSSEMRLFLVTGFCGGFTTFSTFAKEGLELGGGDDVVLAAAYLSLSVFLGLCAVWLGSFLAGRV